MPQRQVHLLGMHGRADLHMHSTYSDGIVTIEQILEHVEHQSRLDVIAITDHEDVALPGSKELTLRIYTPLSRLGFVRPVANYGVSATTCIWQATT